MKDLATRPVLLRCDARLVGQVRPLRGARELLTYLTEARVPFEMVHDRLLDADQHPIQVGDIPRRGTSQSMRHSVGDVSGLALLLLLSESCARKLWRKKL